MASSPNLPDMAHSSDPFDAENEFDNDFENDFENDYERQWVLKRAAQVAGCIIHNHMDKDDRERLARLAADVGRKIRDFLVKRPRRGFLYKTCLCPYDLNIVDLATWLAFRSECEVTENLADVDHFFCWIEGMNVSLGCSDFDDYLSKRFAQWEDYGDEAIGFPVRELSTVEHTDWANDFTEMMRPRTEVNEMLLGYKELDARDFFEADKPITQSDVRKFMYDCRVHRREHLAKKLQDFAEGRTKFSKEILFTKSGFPIISEPDQIDIVCAFCEDSLPISSLDQLRSYCRKRGHAFDTALSRLGRQGEVLRLRHRDQAATSSSEEIGLATCPGCGQTAETWDAVDWHFSRVHEGKLEESLHGKHLIQYLVWKALRTPITRQLREIVRQYGINLDFLTGLCSKAA